MHRLFQRRVTATADVVSAARGALRPDERVALENAEAVIDAAARIWQQLRDQPEVATLLDAATTVLTEVPFSMRLPKSPREIVRGTIDCVTIDEAGRVTVIEFKTGSRRPSHDAQLALYVRAARTVFAGAEVTGRLVYNSSR